VGTTKKTKNACVCVGVVLCNGRINPVVASEDILVDVSVHPFTRSASRKRPASTHVGVQDSIGEEVRVQETGALQG